MPNAKEVGNSVRRFLLIGAPGSGKTTQLLTMPKPALALLFDPDGLESLRGFDIEYETFFAAGYDTHLKTVGGVRPAINGAAQAHEKFNQYLQKLASGGAAKYATIMLDSFTTLQLLIEQGLLQDRQHDMLTPKRGLVTGDKRNQDDYAPLTRTAIANVAQLATLNVNLILTAHVREERDSEGKVQGYSLNAIGALRQSLPAFFAHVFFLRAVGRTNGVAYSAYTHSTPSYAGLKTSFRALPYEIDLTIQDFTKPEEYGLGKLIREQSK